MDSFAIGSVRSFSEQTKTPQPGATEAEAEETADTSGDENKTVEKEESVEESLQKQVDTLQVELSEAKDHLLRALAEAENVRMRSSKDVDSARTYGIQKFAKQLLDVADNLDRAIDAVPEEERVDSEDSNHHLVALFEGVEMTSKELKKVFAANSIIKYGEVGDKFDPHVHEAMFQMPDETKESNTIAQVVKSGYKFKDRVLRPAQVGTVA